MKRLTAICGYYGSGKSEVCINLALQKNIDTIVDLDVINPYFRSREVEALLKEKNIQVISSGMQNALGSDLPYISKEVLYIFAHPNKQALLDLGGSPVGALLLRQAKMVSDDELELLFCVNVYRMETSSVEKIIEAITAIEASSNRKVTGIINNSNQLRETTLEDVLVGQEICLEVAKKMLLRIVYTSVLEQIKDGPFKGEVIGLNLYLRREWL